MKKKLTSTDHANPESAEQIATILNAPDSVIAQAAPKLTISPAFNKPARLTPAQRAEADAALKRMGKP